MIAGKVVVAGSRDINDSELLWMAMLEAPFAATEIVSGGCRGVDELGEAWAELHMKPVKRFLANWLLGKRAGPLRNRKMAEYGDALVALWDGKSAGTRSMIDLMLEAKKPVFVLIVPEEHPQKEMEW